MLKQFFDWWVLQMLAWLPARLRRRDLSLRPMLVLRLQDGERLSMARRSRGAETGLGTFTLDAGGMAAARDAAGPHRSLPPVLHLPPGRLLERRVALPLAAEAELERVLGYEMDRITPFAAAELYWSWRLERRDREQKKLHLRLSMVHRAGLTGVLAALRQAGLQPGMLTADAADGTQHWMPLQREAAGLGWMRRATRAAAWVCAGLALAVIAAPMGLNGLAIHRANARIEALRPRLAEAEALRARFAADAGSASSLAAEAARVGDALHTLALLTSILPDDTSLSALSLRARALNFTGQSANAARLIAILSANPAFRDPGFASPVTRAEANGADLFSIRTGVGL